MYFKTFYFLLFIVSTVLFFLSSLEPQFILNLCGSICHDKLSLNYIKLTSMSMSAISLVLFVLSNYYGQKKLLREKEKIATDRLNIEQIHAELEAMKA
ncbi:MAG: Unknown protein [uncultured Sulfurovum sp.]|uniref:Uncharacterized protein n=1 Tax=uncultured Sulfurovum sp. TaxID=269237 RepID=A0A6S6TJ54_9BACT|nr:MAG: Unknown protein [uncultured Sulfurovum sp.]